MKKYLMAILALCIGSAGAAHAQDIYKWRDAEGKLHLGDRSHAPDDARKMDLQVQSPPVSQPVSPPAAPPARTLHRAAPDAAFATASAPVDPSTVGPGCLELAKKISEVKPGTPWTDLSNEFNRRCPGIAYQCKVYRRRPEDNRCSWVKRTGNSVVQTSIYE
jgi:hypothetical protein